MLTENSECSWQMSLAVAC